jgi:glycosyltransferase involved in cell wall biosynthesis
MTSFNNILHSRRRNQGGGLKKAVFVSYGTFDCNSAGHIAGFARELKAAGLEVAVCARQPVEKAYAFGPPPFEFFSLDGLILDPEGVLGFDGSLDPATTMMIGWTPRKAVRRALGRAVAQTGVPYILHFEDNEELLSELSAAEAGEDEAAKAALEAERSARQTLLMGARGATIIERRLKELLPENLPSVVLEPGVDFEVFAAPLPPRRRDTLLRALGAPPGCSVIVYPGHVHRANQGEMAELYRAIKRLRDAGRPVVLIKTGLGEGRLDDLLDFPRAEAGVIEAGLLDRAFLVELIKCADLFVQPGAPGPFNDYRLPSKLPEFMAVGRPIVLPRSNVGLRLRDGEDALLLETGSAEEIAGKVTRILDDAELGARLSRNAQAFARKTYVWPRQGEKLLDFLNAAKARAA